jgi:hypothetical protein
MCPSGQAAKSWPGPVQVDGGRGQAVVGGVEGARPEWMWGTRGKALRVGGVRLEPFLQCFEWFAGDESHPVIVEHGRAPFEDCDDG